MPTGFDSPIPYFYPLYFTVLLVHRQRRDDASCREKYGKDWDKVSGLVTPAHAADVVLRAGAVEDHALRRKSPSPTPVLGMTLN